MTKINLQITERQAHYKITKLSLLVNMNFEANATTQVWPTRSTQLLDVIIVLFQLLSINCLLLQLKQLQKSL